MSKLLVLLSVILFTEAIVIPISKRSVDIPVLERTSEYLKLGGNLASYGTFWGTIGLGTPAQNLALILDTGKQFATLKLIHSGSSGLHVESIGCLAGCPTPTSTWFNPLASQTFQKLDSGCSKCWTSGKFSEINMLTIHRH